MEERKYVPMLMRIALIAGKICGLLAVPLLIATIHLLFYLVISLFTKKKKFPDAAPRNYAVLICARNEAEVLPYLIDSINKQNYPADKRTVFVLADNCTDDTAEVARKAGAVVYERFNKEHVGKGYAMEVLLGNIDRDCGWDTFDGYFVFDADNVVDKNYIKEMNKVFAAGHNVVSGYRNAKNYDQNWLTACYGLYFLRESQYVNRARMAIGTSCAISGTGLLIGKDIVKRNGGWKFFTLTEDLQFTMDSVTQGDRIAYCEDAITYDEQPSRMVDSIMQRERWMKGYLQSSRLYGWDMLKKGFSGKSFACLDMLVSFYPVMVFAVAQIIALVLSILAMVVVHDPGYVASTLLAWAKGFGIGYAALLALGAIPLISEWKRIIGKPIKKILYLFTFPIFMFTSAPVAALVMFKHVVWVSIPHTYKVSVDDIVGK